MDAQGTHLPIWDVDHSRVDADRLVLVRAFDRFEALLGVASASGFSPERGRHWSSSRVTGNWPILKTAPGKLSPRYHSERSASITLMRAARAAGQADARTAAARRTRIEPSTGKALGICTSWK